MRRFLVHALLFFLIALALASAMDWAATAGLHELRSGDYIQWNDIRSGAAAADILVQGSSRAWTGFSPVIIGQATGMSVYNLGVDGYPLDMQLARYAMYREYNPKPKVIVQTLDVFGLVVRDKIYRPAQFLPYVGEPYLRQNLSRYDYFHWYDYHLPLVRYRGDPGRVRLGLFQLAGLYHSTSKRVAGYQGQDRTWDPKPLEDFVAANPNGTSYMIDPAVEAGLDAMLERCSEEGVFVVFVYPPEYIRAQPVTTNRAEIMGTYQRLAAKYGFPFLDYSSDPICLDTKYFYNSQHMNTLGAETFSTEFAAELQQLLEDWHRPVPAGG